MTKREEQIVRRWAAVIVAAMFALFLLSEIVTGEPARAENTRSADLVGKPIGITTATTDAPVVMFTGRDDIVCGDHRLDYITQEYLQKLCERYGLDYALVLALAETESGFDVQAENPDTHCFGLLQVSPCNYKDMQERGIDIETVAGSMEAGCVILRDKLRRHGTVERALMAYHCGSAGAEAMWREGVTETAYTRTVLARYEKWTSLLEG